MTRVLNSPIPENLDASFYERTEKGAPFSVVDHLRRTGLTDREISTSSPLGGR
jgi:hypothetical protein